jgi:glutamyl aminopeptidase
MHINCNSWFKVNKRLSNEGSTILELKQERFFKNPEEENSGNDKPIWNIPILITAKSSYPNIFKSVLMDTKILEVDLGKLDNTDWIKLNSNNLGFFRVNYSKKYFEELIVHLDDANKLGSTLDRFGLVSDAFAMVKLNDINQNNSTGEVFLVFNKIIENVTTLCIF